MTLADALQMGKPEWVDERGVPYWIMQTSVIRRVEEEMLQAMPTMQRGLILEIGCLFGDMTQRLAQKYPGCSIYGIDINPSAIAAANRMKPKNVLFREIDGYYPAEYFTPGSIDMVIAANNLVFEAHKMRPLMMQEVADSISSVIAEDGYLVVSSRNSFMIARKRGDCFSTYKSQIYDMSSDHVAKEHTDNFKFNALWQYFNYCEHPAPKPRRFFGF